MHTLVSLRHWAAILHHLLSKQAHTHKKVVNRHLWENKQTKNLPQWQFPRRREHQMGFKQAKTQHMSRVWAKCPARGQSAGAHCQAWSLDQHLIHDKKLVFKSKVAHKEKKTQRHKSALATSPVWSSSVFLLMGQRKCMTGRCLWQEDHQIARKEGTGSGCRWHCCHGATS